MLQGRRDWTGAELADRLEVTRRTVRRDVDRLRELGYPIESLAGPAGGYRLAAGSEMPPCARRRGGGGDRRRAAECRGLRRGGNRGGLGPRPGEARAGAALAVASASAGAPSGHHDPGRRPDRGPRLPDHHRRRGSRLRAGALRLLRQGGGRDGGARWSRTRWSTAAAAGTSSPGTWAARTGGASAWTASPAPPRPASDSQRELPAKDAGAFLTQHQDDAEPLRGGAGPAGAR